MIIEISDDALAHATEWYHRIMVDGDQYTPEMVRGALEAYLQITAAHFVEYVGEFEFERPDTLENCLVAAKEIAQAKQLAQ